ncbi:ferroxidase fet3 [Chytridiales sp. JEL 0842]|nr:ferroxidase fet3 [Chytridiales sp. JEL 0842]
MRLFTSTPSSSPLLVPAFNLLLQLAQLIHPTLAKDVIVNWDITYTQANPTDLQERRVIGVNGQWPPPPINVDFGDTLIVNMKNSLDVPTSLHSHGLFQNGTVQYDGPAFVTQCPVPPGESFQYRIPIQQHGTYWIHGHNLGHYVDGLRAPLILHATKEAYKYDYDLTLGLSDWYHDEHPVLLKQFLSIYNPGGAEPIPDAALINHKKDGDEVFTFVPGKTYRIRLICMTALATFRFWIDGHDFQVIEVDGVDTQPLTVGSLKIAAAQRYSVLVKAREASNATNVRYLLHADMDLDMFDNPPASLNPRVTAQIVYSNSSSAAPLNLTQALEIPLSPESLAQTAPTLTVDTLFDPPGGVEATLQDTDLVPLFPQAPFESVVMQSHTLKVTFELMNDGTNRGLFNKIAFKHPLVPPLFSAISLDASTVETPEAYGRYTHPLVIPSTTQNTTTTTLIPVVEIILINDDPGNHPFHLHGHTFQILHKSTEPYDPSVPLPTFPENPVRRDTVVVPSQGFAVLRFTADNPGIWLFHCHIEWHLEAGLSLLFFERPLELPQRQTGLDPTFTQHCEKLGIPTRGNAVGKMGLDLGGYENGVDPLVDGFEAKGVWALVGCIVSAVLGLGVVGWFGWPEKGDVKEE